jgi:hypothetical protein
MAIPFSVRKMQLTVFLAFNRQPRPNPGAKLNRIQAGALPEAPAVKRARAAARALDALEHSKKMDRLPITRVTDTSSRNKDRHLVCLSSLDWKIAFNPFNIRCGCLSADSLCHKRVDFPKASTTPNQGRLCYLCGRW